MATRWRGCLYVMVSRDIEVVSQTKTTGRAVYWLREWWWIILLGMLVQGFWALRLQHPAYFDAYYYTTNGQRLADGYGFTEEIVWQYLDEPKGLPTPSHTYWMPLTSIIAAAGYALSDSFRAAQAPFWLMASFLPLLGYMISWRIFRNRRQARIAALLTMAGGYYTAYWVQPTTFVLFAWVGGGCLFALAMARRQALLGDKGRRWWLLAGLTAGLAHLTRADGLLILGVAGLMWLLQVRDRWRDDRDLPWQSGALLGLGYFLVMAPWLYRTWSITGQPLSTVGSQTIFLTVYDDVFSYGRQFNLQQYLAWGWRNILTSKLEAIWLAVQTYVVVIGLIIFGFFAVQAGLVIRRRGEGQRFLQPASWYAVILFMAMALIFTFPGQRGSLLHSSTALWPWVMGLAPAGIDFSVDWISARRPRWRPETAKRFFHFSFVLLAFAVTIAVASTQPLRRELAMLYGEMGDILPQEAVVMTGDPPGFHYHTGLAAIATPNEPPPVMLQAARQFGATHLLMDPDMPAPLAALYEGEDRSVALDLVRDFGEGFRLYRLPDGSVREGEQ